MILKSQYYFANISAMKAWVYKKFETLAHKVKMNYYKNVHEKFQKDPSFNCRDICKIIDFQCIYSINSKTQNF